MFFCFCVHTPHFTVSGCYKRLKFKRVALRNDVLSLLTHFYSGCLYNSAIDEIDTNTVVSA